MVRLRQRGGGGRCAIARGPRASGDDPGPLHGQGMLLRQDRHDGTSGGPRHSVRVNSSVIATSSNA